MRFVRAYFLEPWPQPVDNAYGHRFTRVYVLPILAGALLHILTGGWAGPAVILVPVALAWFATAKTRHWQNY